MRIYIIVTIYFVNTLVFQSREEIFLLENVDIPLKAITKTFEKISQTMCALESRRFNPSQIWAFKKDQENRFIGTCYFVDENISEDADTNETITVVLATKVDGAKLTYEKNVQKQQDAVTTESAIPTTTTESSSSKAPESAIPTITTESSSSKAQESAIPTTTTESSSSKAPESDKLLKLLATQNENGIDSDKERTANFSVDGIINENNYQRTPTAIDAWLMIDLCYVVKVQNITLHARSNNSFINMLLKIDVHLDMHHSGTIPGITFGGNKTTVINNELFQLFPFEATTLKISKDPGISRKLPTPYFLEFSEVEIFIINRYVFTCPVIDVAATNALAMSQNFDHLGYILDGGVLPILIDGISNSTEFAEANFRFRIFLGNKVRVMGLTVHPVAGYEKRTINITLTRENMTKEVYEVEVGTDSYSQFHFKSIDANQVDISQTNLTSVPLKIKEVTIHGVDIENGKCNVENVARYGTAAGIGNRYPDRGNLSVVIDGIKDTENMYISVVADNPILYVVLKSFTRIHNVCIFVGFIENYDNVYTYKVSYLNNTKTATPITFADNVEINTNGSKIIHFEENEFLPIAQIIMITLSTENKESLVLREVEVMGVDITTPVE